MNPIFLRFQSRIPSDLDSLPFLVTVSCIEVAGHIETAPSACFDGWSLFHVFRLFYPPKLYSHSEIIPILKIFVAGK